MPRLIAIASRAACAVMFVSLLAILPTAQGGTFLDRQALPPVENLLEEVQQSIGDRRFQLTDGRIETLEDAMRPIFKSLLQTADGLLPPSAVRYLLHRVFVDRHTWFVRGIENTGAGWNTSSPSMIFVEHGGESTDDIFERRLNSGGFTLRDTAVFAATFESMVQVEFVDRLDVAYKLTGEGIAKEGAREAEVEKVLDTFMLMYVLAINHTRATASAMPKLWERSKKYPHWSATQSWARDIRREVVSSVGESRTAYSTTVQVVFEMMDRYGRWQNHECDSMKRDLMEIEWSDTGRVRLQDFYNAALNGKWLFSEAKEYLGELGALDEATLAVPAVLIANYINAPSNCLAESKFYSVCCVNECEALLSPIERHIATPTGLPADIIRIVEALPSATVDAPRTLPRGLLERLDEIASQHGGRVPIHGRLFAQWMHHAYPRECPFPHASGTVQVSSRKELSSGFGEHVLGEDALRAEAEAHATEGVAMEACELPWTSEEELFVHAPTARPREGWLRHCVGVAAMASMFVATLRSAAIGAGSVGGRKGEKCLV